MEAFRNTAMVTTAAAFWRTTFQSTGCGGAMYRVGTSSTLGCLALMLGNDTIIVPSFLLGAVIPEKKRVASWRPSSNSTVVVDSSTCKQDLQVQSEGAIAETSLGRFQQFADAPNVIGDSSGHSGRHAKRLVDSAKIVKSEPARYKRKVAVAPPRGFTWEGVLESAMNELENAKENGDQARCDQLRTSIQIAKRNVKLGKPFPVSPN